MSTQRQDDNNIISSNSETGTVRSNNSVIGSEGNTSAILSSSLSNDIILNGKEYQIVSQIARSGEAEVFLVATNNQKFIFKYYYSQYKPKDEILNKLKGLQHPDIIALLDFGYFQDRFFEIAEYAEGGTLSEIMPVSSLSKTQEIVKETIEALNYCHNHGIIHRDIKPENIFFRTADKKDIAIGDFGIASNIKEGEELVRTTLARTSLYAAPELFTNIQGKTTIEKSVDYYALGMTLLHLWVGKNPFEDVDEFGIMRLKSEGRVLFPDGIDSDVEKLIKGLITVNPRDRWSYNEVKSWLNGEDVRVLYQTIQLEYKPYSFGLIDGEQIVVNNPKDLAGLLEKYPEKGEGHLYRNTIAKWIEQVDQGLFNELMDIVEKEFPKDRTAGLTKAIYILDQDRPFKGADKTKLRSQEEIASYFEDNFGHYQNDLKNPNAAFYVFLEARNYKQKADEYRHYFKTYNPELALNTLILTLQGADKFIVGSYTIYQPGELLKLPDELKPRVIQGLSNTNSKLSLWITNFKNLEPTITKWRVLRRYDNYTLRYALQEGFQLNDSIAVSESEFYQLFKDKNDLFFSSGSSSALQNEANYWLLNYQNSSLTRVAINYLKAEKYSDNEFLQILNYVLENHSDAKLNIYEVIDELLDTIQEKTKDNAALQQRILELCEVNIEKTWASEQANAKQFIDCINEYLSFSDANISKHSEFLSQLTYQLDDRISNGIRNDINLCKGNEKTFNDYYTDIKQCIQRLEKINNSLPYVNRHKKEINLIQHQQSIISSKLSDEKQGKINITYDTYNDILVKRRAGDRQYTKKQFLKRFVISLAIAIIAFALLLTTIDNGYNSLKILTGALVILGVGLGILAGILSENLVVAIIACILFAWLGGKYGPQIPIKSIYILCCLTVAFFGGRAILVNYRREKAISEIKLNSTEETGLKQSFKSVDDHFNKKQHYEHYDETLRLLLLDDDDFEKEYSSKESKLDNNKNTPSFLVNQQTDYSNQLTAINTPITKKLKVVNYAVGSLILITLILGIWKYSTTDYTYFGYPDYQNSNTQSTTPSYSSSTYYTVSASQANMRQTPSKNGTLLTTLYQGATVEVINTQNSGWYNGYEGYISSKLLTYGTNSYNSSTTPSTTTNEYTPENNNTTPPSVVKDEEVKQKQYQWVTCSDCNGSGIIQAGENCNYCNGYGTLRCQTCSGNGSLTCTGCKGNGSLTCTNCRGNGSLTCTGCRGNGSLTCTVCKGNGSFTDRNGNSTTCTNCRGNGSLTCTGCRGNGSLTCTVCRGNGSLTCTSCRGNGNLQCKSCKGTGNSQCSNCLGKGKTYTNSTCGKCSGKGQVQQEL
jgi:serine/threonine protein kinase